MKILNQQEISKLTSGRLTPKVKARAKVGELRVGQVMLFSDYDKRRFGGDVRNLISNVEGKFSVIKYRQGTAVKRTQQ